MPHVRSFALVWVMMALLGQGCSTQPGPNPPDGGPGDPGGPGSDPLQPPAGVLLIPPGVYTGEGEFRTTLRIDDAAVPETTTTTETERFGPNGEYQLSDGRTVVVGSAREFGEGAVVASVESITHDSDRIVIDYEIVIIFDFVTAPLTGTLHQVFTLDSDGTVRMVIEAAAAAEDDGAEFELQSEHLLVREAP